MWMISTWVIDHDYNYHVKAPDLQFICNQRSKTGQKGQKGQISKIVANSLKRMENQSFVQKTCLNHFLRHFSHFS